MTRMAFERGKEFAISFLEKFDGVGVEDKKPDEPKSTDQPDVVPPGEQTNDIVQKVSKSETKVGNHFAIKVVLSQVTLSSVQRNYSGGVTSRQQPSQQDIPTVKEQSGKSDIIVMDVIDTTESAQQPDRQSVDETVKVEIIEPTKEIPLAQSERRLTPPPPLPNEILPNEIVKTVDAEVKIDPIAVAEENTTAQKTVTVNSNSPETLDTVTVTDDSEIKQVADEPVVIEQTIPDGDPVVEKALPLEIKEVADDPLFKASSQPHYETIIEPIVELPTPKIQTESSAEFAVVTPDEIIGHVATLEIETVGEDFDDRETIQIEDNVLAEQQTYSTETIDTPRTELAEIIDNVIEQSHEHEQSAEKQLVEIVRSIEILKWSTTGEECHDALVHIRAHLITFFYEQGCDDPELLVEELLQKYEMMDIDAVMNAALKTARHKSSRRLSVPTYHMSLGRHVMKLVCRLYASPRSVYVATM